MKETKVYVDDETLMKCERYRHNSCPIIKTHDHDKELVAKVLERIKSLITKYDLLKDYQNCAGYFILDKIIEQIQKEIAEL